MGERMYVKMKKGGRSEGWKWGRRKERKVRMGNSKKERKW